MIPNINSIQQVSTDQSVVCLIGKDGLLPELKLSVSEKEYVKRCIADNEDVITVNSYYKLAIFVKEKDKLEGPELFEDLRIAGVKIYDELKRYKQKSIAITSGNTSTGALDALSEGIILSTYRFAKYKTETDKDSDKFLLESIALVNADKELIERFKDLTEAVFFARDRVNEPLSHLNAEAFASSIADFCKGAGLGVETLTRKQIEALKMGGLIAVNKGSVDPPTFSIIDWNPDNAINKKPLILVGKGVVFDTGGLNLKPTNYIEDMKADMAGAAAVSAVMYYIAKRKLPLKVKALVPATDNRPGKDAYAPGDVITMYNGLSVEVLNTDAEGRLILADALSYADKFDPSLVISMATLTGSASSTFGNKAIAAMGNADKEYLSLLSEAGDLAYERIAILPFWKEYGEMLKSDIADLKNIGGKAAGAITAGKFLENFTTAPFIHLDIAGTAMISEKDHYRPKGGTGSGVRLLALFLEDLASGKTNKVK